MQLCHVHATLPRCCLEETMQCGSPHPQELPALCRGAAPKFASAPSRCASPAISNATSAARRQLAARSSRGAPASPACQPLPLPTSPPIAPPIQLPPPFPPLPTHLLNCRAAGSCAAQRPSIKNLQLPLPLPPPTQPALECTPPAQKSLSTREHSRTQRCRPEAAHRAHESLGAVRLPGGLRTARSCCRCPRLPQAAAARTGTQP